MTIHDKNWDYWLSCYLDNELSEEDQLAVEQLILWDSDCRKELDLMKRATQCLERVLKKHCVNSSSAAGE